ncbi:MAG: PilZ domain-containing protein [Candidatus Brocadiales bacterium]
MNPLFIIIPAAVILIGVISFVFYRKRIRADKSKKSEASDVQRREYFRIDVHEQEPFTVILEIDGSKLTGCKLINISIGGAAVLAVRHPIVLDVGSRIKKFKIIFPGGEEVMSSATIRYVFREVDTNWDKYGIQFVGLSDIQSSIIARYVIQTEVKKIKEQRTMAAKEGKAGL